MRILYKLLTVTILIAALTSLFYGIKLEKKESLNILLEWSRLAPLPNNAKVIHIKTTGGLFTRGYRCIFTAHKQSINEWMRKSPGIQHAITDPPSKITKVIHTGRVSVIVSKPHNTYRYVIPPQKGINWAEVNIDNSYTKVEIYTYKD